MLRADQVKFKTVWACGSLNGGRGWRKLVLLSNWVLQTLQNILPLSTRTLYLWCLRLGEGVIFLMLMQTHLHLHFYSWFWAVLVRWHW